MNKTSTGKFAVLWRQSCRPTFVRPGQRQNRSLNILPLITLNAQHVTSRFFSLLAMHFDNVAFCEARGDRGLEWTGEARGIFAALWGESSPTFFRPGQRRNRFFWDDLLSRLALTGFCTKALDQISTRATVNTLNLFHESFGMLTFSFIADYVALRL